MIEKFLLRPVVVCDSCPSYLEYVKQPDGGMLLWHARAGCKRDMQMFEAPSIELTPVPSALTR